jgi:hypothetical protein
VDEMHAILGCNESGLSCVMGTKSLFFSHAALSRPLLVHPFLFFRHFSPALFVHNISLSCPFTSGHFLLHFSFFPAFLFPLIL